MPTDNVEVSRYLDSLSSPQKEICQNLREMIGSQFPGLREQFKWSRPVYGTESDGDVCYMVANSSDVNFGFDLGAKLSDSQNLLEGTGVNQRHLKFRSLADLNLAYCENLLGEAVALTEQ